MSHSNSTLRRSSLMAALFASMLGLAACSGGDIGAVGGTVDPEDGRDPTNPNNPDPSEPAIASITVIAESSSLRSDADTAAEGTTVSALARDANNNVVQGVTVTFGVDNDAAIQVTQGTTDATGVAQAVLTTGGNRANRDLTVSATSQGQTDSLLISVSGTRLSLTGPQSVGSGDSAQYRTTLVDAGDAGVANEDITITSANGNQISASTMTTNTDGEVLFTLTGVVGGDDTLTVSALGESATQTVSVSAFNLDVVAPNAGTEFDLGSTNQFSVNVQQNGVAAANQAVSFSSTRGSVSASTVNTDANGNASVTFTSDGPGGSGPAILSAATTGGAGEDIAIEFVATSVASLTTQAQPSSVPINGSSTIRTIARDANDNLVKNQIIDFQLVDQTGGSLSAGSATTDTQGIATTTFTAGSVSSGTENVRVTASLRTNNMTNGSAFLTVGGEALRIALGTGNTIFEADETSFNKPYTVVVSDAAGNPAPDDTVFRLEVVSTGYRTGRYCIVDVDPDPDAEDLQYEQFVAETLPTEDVDFDGVLDPGEDRNNSGSLEPEAVATVPATIALDERGHGQFNVSYPENHNTWTEVTLIATATVAGTESTEFVTFYLPALAEDFNSPDDNPPGVVSPYGDGGIECVEEEEMMAP